MRPEIIFEIPKQPWDLKPLDLDTLEIAQLAHHLIPIFGLVLNIHCLDFLHFVLLSTATVTAQRHGKQKQVGRGS